jgi:dimethylhistidine N-methyltransferase
MKKDKKNFLKELKEGLSKKNKTIPSKFHYDLLGSKYFEKITQQKEYYPTRKEKEILKKLSKRIPFLFSGDLSFVEIGSGAADKIKILLNKKVKYYIPLDISVDFVKKSVASLKKKYPNLKVKPIKIDYSKPFKIPNFKITKKIYFFLGSSIGNFHNKKEINFLKNIRKSIGKKNYLFVGVDLIKNKQILENAYNDKNGYTSKFSLNLINIINRNFKSGLNIKNFYYKGIFNNRLKCIQGFLVSKINQSFFLGKKKFFLKKNENIQVEISNKFTTRSFSQLSRLAGWKVEKYWLDKQKYFAVFLLKS